MIIREGRLSDVPAVLGLLDGATAWLVAAGRTGQWGTEPHSTDPRRIEQVTGFATAGELWVGEDGERVVGALAVGAATPHVPPAGEPELYVRLLISDREARGQRIGTRLLEYAEQLARDSGVHLLRVDCYAGDDQALVRYYERQGFTRTETFAVPVSRADGSPGHWPGQVLARRW